MPTFRKNDALPTDHVFWYELRGVQSIKLVEYRMQGVMA